MEQTILHKDGIAILRLAGRFDAFEADTVKAKLTDAIESSSRVIVDLTQVNFMDSSALAVLVQGMKHCRQNNGDLYLSNLQDTVRTIFELTRLDKAIQIYDTTDEALNAFKA